MDTALHHLTRICSRCGCGAKTWARGRPSRWHDQALELTEAAILVWCDVEHWLWSGNEKASSKFNRDKFSREGAHRMIARVTSVQFSPDKLGEVYSSIEAGIAAVQQAQGFQGLLFLADRSTGKVVMISQWEGDAAMEASNSLRQEQLAKVAPMVVGPVITEVFEVLAKV
jgi:quinol monooxygenase YgiN